MDKYTRDVYGDGGLYTYFIEFICKKFVKIVKGNDELWKFINDNKISLDIDILTTSECIKDEFSRHKGHLRKDTVNRSLDEWIDKEQNNTLSVATYYKITDVGRVYISAYVLQIKQSSICLNICKRIFDLDDFENELEVSVKHEVGHMLDYMRNEHGISFQEFQKLQQEKEKDYHDFYDWLAKQNDDGSQDYADMVNDRYYGIPQEARANFAAGVDFADRARADRARVERFGNKIVTLNIDISKLKDEPKEDKKRNAWVEEEKGGTNNS